MTTKTAAEVAADALDVAAKALRTLSTVSTLVPGQVVTDILADLPVGAIVKDRDGDEYRRTEDEYVTTRYRDRTNIGTIKNYSPVKLVSLPNEPAPAAPFKNGDRVKISGLSIYGGRADGQNGTVTNVDAANDEVTVLPDGFGQGDKIYRAYQLTKVAPEPASRNLTLTAGRNTLRVEPSAVNRKGGFLNLSTSDLYASGSRSIHMTREDTLKLIASLQAIVD